MTQVFKDFMRSIEATGEPSDAAVDELWTELRRLLRRALQVRGLWDRPPSYLGVTGHPGWTTPRTADRSGFPTADQDALDELATDFYVEMFVTRLPSLRRYFERGDNLEKVVRLGAGQLIQDRQRQNDRLGYRLFQWLRAALAQAVAYRRLYVLAGHDKIRNDTVLGFDSRASEEPASDDALAAVVRAWNDDLLHDWVAARGKAVTALIDRLEDQLQELRQAGVEVFGFKSLVDAFKRDVRERLGAFLGGGVTFSEDPLRSVEERQRIEELSTCVEAGIRGGGGQLRTRDKLLELWRFLVAFALTAADPERSRGAGGALMAALQGEKLPSHRQLSRLLGIRHDRFPALLARIKEDVERCFETLGRSRPSVALAPLQGDRHMTPGDAANTDTLGASAGARGSEANLDETRDLRQKLKRLTADAYRRDAPAAPATDPEPGALYHLEACPEPGVEWLLVEVDANSDGWVIPADSLPLLGSADVAAAGDAGTGPLSLRCDLGVWFGSDVLRGDRRTVVLSAADLDRALERCHHLAAGGDVAEASEIDVDSDYREWRHSLEVARNAVSRVYGGRVERLVETAGRPAVDGGKVVPIRSKEYSRPSWRHVAAAAAIVIASGAGVWIWDVHKDRDRLARQLDIERQPESAIPWLLAPLGTRRGSPEVLVVPPEARSIGLLIDAANGDRLEIRDATGSEVWTATVERIDSPDEALVRIPVERMPPGEYGVKVRTGDVLKVEFEVRIESP